MWKFVARGIRETFERRVCRTNVYSQSSQDNPKNEIKTTLTCHQKFLSPVFVTCGKVFCESAKSAGTDKDTGHDSDWKAKHSWTEAFGWSSALAAGWVVCQTLCLHKRFFDRDSKETLKNKLFNYVGVSHILDQISNIQARHVLPVTNCVGKKVGKKSSWQDSSSQWNEEKQFGPITLEEELKRVSDEFANIHVMVAGEYELRLGTTALEEKRYKDALMHFIAGAKMSSPGSMFNLGLCYELGIGTVADQSEAAKHYNDAAAHDHADALYNLGVFHTQGRGDLPINIDIARTYFTRAAQLGQVQAEHALNLETVEKLKKNTTVVPDTCSKDLTENKADYTPSTSAEHTQSANFAESACEVIDLNDIVEDFVTLCLGLRGLREPDIMITSSDCHVPDVRV